jgi:hypothetical protein
MMFTIDIEYVTGDTFQSYETKEAVGHLWANQEAAQESLERILAHKAAVHDHEFRYRHKPQSFDERYKNEPWFVSLSDKPEWNDSWKYFVKVVGDQGEPVIIYAFWMGYFESLLDAYLRVE